MKYFVWGYYGHRNLGDDLMLKEIVGRVVASDPGAMFLVRSHFPVDLPRVESRRMEAVGGPRPWRVVRTLARVARSVGASDVVLIGGGTLFLDKGRFSASIVHVAFAVWAARRMRKPVHVLGVGIDTLSHPVTVLLVRYILRRSQSVALRDRFSMEYAARHVEHAVLSSDLLFNADFVESLRRRRGAEKTDIVICVSEYLGSWRSGGLQARFTERLLEMLRRLSGWQAEGRVVLCPFQRGVGDRDAEFCDRLAKELALPNVHVVPIDDMDDVAAVFGRAKLTISMRFHALVFSSILGCPFIGISIEAKIRELSALFDMPWVYPEEFVEQGLSEAFLKRAAGLTVCASAVARQVARSPLNFSWLAARP